MTTFQKLTKTSTFTQFLTPDAKVPTIEAAKSAGAELIRTARMVEGSFTWLVPGILEGKENPKYEVVAVSPSAMKDLGLQEGEETTELFKETVSGYSSRVDAIGVYPWAQAYAGWQFGQWAGQLGDGRAVSLFEGTNKTTGKRYELQLKGGGLTPYSRFADGKAVLRSSIREALGSEAVNALGIPTTRALSLVNLPETMAVRESLESCAVVCRMAETWVRIGTFDLHRARGARKEMRKLADYCIEHVFGYEPNNSGRKVIDAASKTRYQDLYTEIVKRNANTTALWQAYGFLNGVLNTDNTSIFGLTLDYGPFAFMDTFDPSYTPNHDDGMLRYSYRNTPSVILWNLVRLGEDLGELLGAAPDFVDDTEFIEKGLNSEQIEGVKDRAETFIMESQKVFETEFLKSFNKTMGKRLGLQTFEEEDHDKILTPLLDMLQACELDFNQFFRKLSDLELFAETSSLDVEHFFPQIRGFAPMYSLEEAKDKLLNWINTVYKPRLEKEGSKSDEERRERMRKVNPKFILKGWILDEVIQKARQNDFTLYHQVQKMALSPFNETWGLPEELENRLTGDVPRSERDSQCSCSS
ncbi:Fmp40p [Sugiyamaella lignohabitans]|uniref:Selenoprotein O n=1 Tax=Sugiyamaella lignohabitans TaxID=796027 RepID=A0A167CHP8_9ASCO|nr:Fmp40p [Sugiyamaella lignohabitans]ANB11714.1 Fmp40p [Sugiyamaella lignohabitans]